MFIWKCSARDLCAWYWKSKFQLVGLYYFQHSYHIHIVKQLTWQKISSIINKKLSCIKKEVSIFKLVLFCDAIKWSLTWLMQLTTSQRLKMETTWCKQIHLIVIKNYCIILLLHSEDCLAIIIKWLQLVREQYIGPWWLVK